MKIRYPLFHILISFASLIPVFPRAYATSDAQTPLSPYLDIDVLTEQDPNSLQTAYRKMLTELNQKAEQPIAATRLNELFLGLATLEYRHQRWPDATRWLTKIHPGSLLFPLSQFIQAKVLLAQAQEKSKAGQHSACQQILQQVQTLLSQLDSYQGQAFSSELPSLRNSVLLLRLKNRIKMGTFDIHDQNSALAMFVDKGFSLDSTDAVDICKALIDRINNKDVTLTTLLDELILRFPDQAYFSQQRHLLKSPPPQAQLKKRIGRIPVTPGESAQDEEWYQKSQTFRGKNPHKELETLSHVLKNFPETESARKASARLNIIVESLAKDEKNHRFLIAQAQEWPPKQAYTVARTLWEMELTQVAATIFAQMIKQQPYSEHTGHAKYFLGRLAEDQQRWQQARSHFTSVVRQHDSSPFFKRAVFKLGWLALLEQSYTEATVWLNRYRQLAQHPNEQAEALFWLGHMHQTQGQTSLSEQFFSELALVAPLSYYAFLVKRLPATLATPINQPLFASAMATYSAGDGGHLQLAKACLGAGFLNYASDHLQAINPQDNLRLKYDLAFLYKTAQNHRKAVTLAFQIIHEVDQEIPHPLLTTVFPQLFQHHILEAASTHTVSPALIFAIIKEESAYQKDAASGAGARGLMQLMPNTAAMVASRLKQPTPSPEDLFTPALNIQLGSRYLADLLKRFDGNLVYALAAYNGGSRNLETWRSRWPNLPLIQFIELIPFDETRNYVKRVLRNFAFYSALIQSPADPGFLFEQRKR